MSYEKNCNFLRISLPILRISAARWHAVVFILHLRHSWVAIISSRRRIHSPLESPLGWARVLDGFRHQNWNAPIASYTAPAHVFWPHEVNYIFRPLEWFFAWHCVGTFYRTCNWDCDAKMLAVERRRRQKSNSITLMYRDERQWKSVQIQWIKTNFITENRWCSRMYRYSCVGSTGTNNKYELCEKYQMRYQIVCSDFDAHAILRVTVCECVCSLQPKIIRSHDHSATQQQQQQPNQWAVRINVTKTKQNEKKVFKKEKIGIHTFKCLQK